MVPLLRSKLPSMDNPLLHVFTSTRPLPFYCTAQAFLWYPPQFLYYEHCLVRALHSHLFKTTTSHVSSLTWIYLNLPCPWISLSLRTTPECALACKPSSLNSLSNRSLPGVAAEAPSTLCSWKHPSRTPLPLSFKSTFASTWVKRNSLLQQGVLHTWEFHQQTPKQSTH